MSDTKHELTSHQREEITAAILQRNQDLLAAWANKDAFEAWMTLYAPDKHSSWTKNQCLLVVNNNSYSTRADIKVSAPCSRFSSFPEMLSGRTTKVTMLSESVSVLSPDHALHFGNFKFSTTRDGATSEEYLAAASTLWVREGETWKILHYHQSWPTVTPVLAKAA